MTSSQETVIVSLLLTILAIDIIRLWYLINNSRVLKIRVLEDYYLNRMPRRYRPEKADLNEEEYLEIVQGLGIDLEWAAFESPDYFSPKGKQDVVITVYSEPEIQCGNESDIHVHLNILSYALRVARIAYARNPKPNAVRSSTLIARIGCGRIVQLLMESKDLEIMRPFQEMVWNRRSMFFKFPVANKNIENNKSAEVTVRLGLDGIEIGMVNFEIKITAKEPNLSLPSPQNTRRRRGVAIRGGSSLAAF